MRILFITPETEPFSTSSSLVSTISEFSGQLPRFLNDEGIDVTIITPFYPGISEQKHGLARRLDKLDVKVGNKMAQVGVLEGKLPGNKTKVIFLDHIETFGRDKSPDDHRRFFLFAQSALQAMETYEPNPDIVHLNGWQTGFFPVLAKLASKKLGKILFTVFEPDNIALFETKILDDLHIANDHESVKEILIDGKISLLKAGLSFADKITTLTPELTNEDISLLYNEFKNKLQGILGGVDPSVWDPKEDRKIASNFDRAELDGKSECKKSLQENLGLPVLPQTPLVAMVGPFDKQSGINIMMSAASELSNLDLQLAFFGQEHENNNGLFSKITNDLNKKIIICPNLDNDQLHQILAGTDGLLIPAIFDPGTIIHFKAMRYGTVPIVRPIGTFKDSVIDFDPPSASGTGIHISSPTADSLLIALNRLISLYKSPKKWRRLVQNTMQQDFSWRKTALLYKQLYCDMISL